MTKKIIARLQNGNFCNIFDNDSNDLKTIENIYNIYKDENFKTDNVYEFDPEKKLEADEWFYVKPNNEQKKELITPYIKTLTNIGSINTITGEDYPNIRRICLVEN